MTTSKLTPIKHPVVKEFLQLILQLNIDAIESMVQGVPVIITKNHVTEMLCLSQIGITKLLAMRFGEASNMCLQMAPLNVQKEGWRIS